MTHGEDKLAQYRQSPTEIARTGDLLRLVPPETGSVLDIGARDGHFSLLFSQIPVDVTALDLIKPGFEIRGVKTVAGDVTHLEFPDRTFDLVFCAEVLEHIPALELACQEIQRVARRYILIGVPFEQDTRVSRTICQACGRRNPPYGHVNSFTEERLRALFDQCEPVERSFVGQTQEATNAMAAWLLDLGGNPWGEYSQDEGCIHCGARLVAPVRQSFWKRSAAAAGIRLQHLQTAMAPVRGNWIHMLFRKKD